MANLNVDTHKYLQELVDENTKLSMMEYPEINMALPPPQRQEEAKKWYKGRITGLDNALNYAILTLGKAERNGFFRHR